MGLFVTVPPEKAKAAGFDIETLHTAWPVETGRSDGAVSVLFAHVVATRCLGDVVTDVDMDYPRDFRSSRPNTSGKGHREDGRTVAIHSLAVHPKLQGCGLGKLIMKAYMQQIHNSGTADRISLICQDVGFFASLAFAGSGSGPGPGLWLTGINSISLTTMPDSATRSWAPPRLHLEVAAGMTW